ncbi:MULTISPECIES: hypothetical protein [Actinomycetes]|uniref:hypothetical protein n=1 Tax=Actinomycetes TaxID=1760 RepID=UPI00131A12E8|nr:MULTISPECIES: hypothetical protein [Actinomycetes]
MKHAIRKTLTSAAAVALLPLALPPGTANAAERSGDTARATRAAVDGLVAANPGAHITGVNTVQLANGVIATFAPNGGPCPWENLCIYDQPGTQGIQWNFYRCGFVNIGLSGWSDRIRSFINNQTSGTVAEFSNWNGRSWDVVGQSTAFEIQDPADPGIQTTDGLNPCLH